MKHIFYLMVLSLLCTACYYSKPSSSAHLSDAATESIDSTAFYSSHHYWKGYNFVAIDSFAIQPTLPTEKPSSESILGEISVLQDSSIVHQGLRLVVADIRLSKANPADSVWINVATEEAQIGWAMEKVLLQKTIPDNSISKFIYRFSQNSILFLLTLLVIGMAFILSKLYRKRRFQMVHFNDIDSFYPTALCLMVSFSASLYGIMQGAATHTWIEFYFHPTLNPFAPALPLVLRLFLLSFWGVIILGVATLEEFYHRPKMRHRATYLGALMGICAILYVVFTLSMRWYIGYPLLAVYWVFAWKQYARHRSAHLRCGNCGKPIATTGICPHCGTFNE